MAKPDPALLDPRRYPHTASVELRFADLDLNQHVNNVALYGMVEEGRVRFHRAIGYAALHTDRTSMVASVAVEYLGQAFYPDPVELHQGLARVGRTSHEIVQLVMQGERVIAFARSVVVSIQNGRPAAFPASYVDSVAAWMLQP